MTAVGVMLNTGGMQISSLDHPLLSLISLTSSTVIWYFRRIVPEGLYDSLFLTLFNILFRFSSNLYFGSDQLSLIISVVVRLLLTPSFFFFLSGVAEGLAEGLAEGFTVDGMVLGAASDVAFDRVLMNSFLYISDIIFSLILAYERDNVSEALT